MLDIVKLFREGRPEHDSLRNIELSMCKHLGVRPLVVPETEELGKHLMRVYKEDDWDLMISEDGFCTSNLFAHYKPIFDSFPLIQMVYALRASAPVWCNQEPYATAIDIVEAAQLLCATEAWFISDYELNMVKNRFEEILTLKALSALLEKSKVLHLGIALDCISETKPVGDAGLRIFFPHRTRTQEKGIDRLLDYLQLLSSKTDMLITLVSHTSRSNVWQEIEQYATIEKMGWLERNEYLKIAAGCDIVFAWPRHENFGIAVLESVAMGCWPVVCDDLAYPEIYPIDFLFSTIEEAVQMTLSAVGKILDNRFVLPYLWKNRKSDWLPELTRVYDNFYHDQDVSKAGKKMAGIVKNGGYTKKRLMTEMGWGQSLGWGKYRNMLRQQGVPISNGPVPVYGEGEVIEKTKKRATKSATQTIQLF